MKNTKFFSIMLLALGMLLTSTIADAQRRGGQRNHPHGQQQNDQYSRGGGHGHYGQSNNRFQNRRGFAQRRFHARRRPILACILHPRFNRGNCAPCHRRMMVRRNRWR